MNVLVTGAAGFIGFHTARRLLDDGHRVTGLDNLNEYYDPALKRARLEQLEGREGFRFELLDVSSGAELGELVAASGFEAGIHAESFHPDCIIVDFSIGRVEALQICQNLRNNWLGTTG